MSFIIKKTNRMIQALSPKSKKESEGGATQASGGNRVGSVKFSAGKTFPVQVIMATGEKVLVPCPLGANAEKFLNCIDFCVNKVCIYQIVLSLLSFQFFFFLFKKLDFAIIFVLFSKDFLKLSRFIFNIII